MTSILGISAYYHDSAAALVVDGEIVAAAQEERFTRKKHDAGFPAKAVEYCLEAAGLTADQLDYIGFYDKPLLKFERSEEHTSELQSRRNLVCRLLLEKKKTTPHPPPPPPSRAQSHTHV